jgi:hypothetical protein
MIHVVALVAALQQSVMAMPVRIAGPVPSALLDIAPRQDTAAPRNIARNWQEPALIGGAIFGTLGTFAGYGLCNLSDTPPSAPCSVTAEESFLFTGTVGAIIGGLAGSSSHPPPPGSLKHGNHGNEGALLLAIPTGAINALAAADNCRSHNFEESCSGSIVGALVNTTINALIGYLIGRSQPRYQLPVPVP